MWYNSTGTTPTVPFFLSGHECTKPNLVTTQSTKNEQHGRVTAQSIGGYDVGRVRNASPSVNWHCGEPWRSHSPWVVQCPWIHQWTPWVTGGSRSSLFESTMVQRACKNWWYSGDGNKTGYLLGKSNYICFDYSEFMANSHELWRSVYAAHTQYEADCLNWQSVITDGHELLSKADFGKFKVFCDNNYFLCRGEYYLYKEWAEVIKAKLR